METKLSSVARAAVVLEGIYLYARTALFHPAAFHQLTAIQQELAWTALRLIEIAALLIVFWKYRLLPVFGRWQMPSLTTGWLLAAYIAQIFLSPRSHHPETVVNIVYAATAVVVAIREELIYRYVLQNWLEEWLKPNNQVVGAVVISSIVFTLSHLGAQPLSLFPWIFIASLTLGAIYISSGKSLLLIVLCHFAADAVIALW